MTGAALVELNANRLLIEHLVIDDPLVVNAARQEAANGHDLAEFLNRALRVGVTALGAVSHSQDLVRLEQALSRVDDEVASCVTQALNGLEAKLVSIAAAESGRLMTATRDAVDRLSAGVQALVSGQDGLLARNVSSSVQSLVERTQHSLQEVIVTQAATTQAVLNEDRERVRAALLAQLGEQQSELRQALDAIRERLVHQDATRQARAASPARGDDYELAAQELVGRLAHATGDLATVVSTGRTTGLDGSKKGDVVVTVVGTSALGDKAPKIVFEAKDRRGTNRPSVKAMTDELRKCRSNRGATCAVAILPPEAMPLRDHKVILLEPRSVCVAWTGGEDDDLVLAAFHLMKLLAISESPRGGRDHDPARLRNQLVELQATVEGFNELEKQVGNADRSVARIRESRK